VRTLTVAACAALLVGCSLAPRREAGPPPAAAGAPPIDIASIPDAVPRDEPRSRRGNPPFYEVMGQRYFVMASAAGYVERGVASWYGPKFHGELTSMGERYDMYGMSAAHKTLPLPAYARVTNLRNGRSVVVRINDRGPFVSKRIIDLSYTAAAKLDMLRDGTALVEVRTVSAGQPEPLTRSSQQPAQSLYVQAGAFADQNNAARLLEKLRAAGLPAMVRPPVANSGSRLHHVRVGPIESVGDYDRIAALLSQLGVTDARLAVD
jgi:rare lipoprotein A